MMMTNRLPRTFYTHDARRVARELLGHLLVTEIDGVRTSGTIIETEAYLGVDDLASHSRRGPTQRNRSMFFEGGHAYIYFIYGMYYCFNVVTGDADNGEAVLIRALEPVEGIDLMVIRRGGTRRRFHDLTNGPGKLTIALGIGPELDGADLTTDLRIRIEPGTPLSDADVIATPRIGISKSTELPWRWLRRTKQE